MKTKLPTLAGISLATLLGSSGCVTSGTQAKVDVLNENRRAIDRNTTAVLAAGRAVTSGTTAPIDDAEKRLGEASTAADAHFAAIREELAKQKLEFQTFVTGALATVGEVTTELVPGGGAAAKVIGLIKNRVESAHSGAAEAKREGEAAKREAANALVDAQKQMASLKTELAAKDELTKQQAALREEQLKRDIEFARREISTLSDQQKVVAREDLVKLAKEKGVIGAEKMSTEELLAALGAAGVGLAGLLRTFGRSRNASQVDQLAATHGDQARKIEQTNGEVDELWTDLKKLDQRLAVIERGAAECNCRELNSEIAKLVVARGDHERRIGVIEAKPAKPSATD